MSLWTLGPLGRKPPNPKPLFGRRIRCCRDMATSCSSRCADDNVGVQFHWEWSVQQLRISLGFGAV